MPVSTFSADSSHVRRHSGHSGMISRWNSTTERMAEDERRMSMNQMMEMDGTGLWERENWPLGPGGDQAGSPKSAKSPVIAEEEEDVSEHAVLRKGEDIGREPEVAAMRFDDSDVSDAEAEGEEHEEEDHTDRRHDDIRETVIEAPRPRQRSDVSPMREGEMLSPVQSQGSGSLSNRPIASSPTAPSPVYEEYERGKQSRQRSSYEFHGQDQQSSAEDDHLGVSPVREEHVHEETDDTSDDEQDYRERAPQHDSNGYPINQSPEMDDEVPPAFSDHSFGPSTPSTTGHGMRSSIAKTTPPTRQPSARRSPSITTQIPFNKERVRYSWQSIQDEEPNRPRIHIIKLVSNTASASAGFPQGEAFNFSISPAGRRIAAYNSARLYILQTGALPVGVSQDYALKRRPLAVEIIDDGNLIAILADQHTVNLYDLEDQRMTIVRSIKLDFPTNCIALAPTGGLLAAAYEGGIEIFSLDANALPTDRRAVRSVKMDRMTFSEDGSTLLGTTTRINVSSTVTVSVPVFPSSQSNIPTHEELKEAWCSNILHPENIRNSSHATFMRENRATCNDRLFAWNGLADTFGILNVHDMQYGNIDFPIVISPPLSTCGGLGAAIHSPPAIDEHGDTVAMVVNDRTIRLYIVPHRVDDDDETSVEAHSIDHELDEGYGCPFSEVRWVYSSASLPAPLSNQTQVQGRLIVVSPGGVVDPMMNEESIDDIEGGRIIMFDFDPQFAGQPGQTFSLTLGKNPPQLLEEPQVDVAQEVALVRRRTVNQSKGNGLSQRPTTLGRAASTFEGRRDRERTRNVSPRNLVGVSAAHRRSVLSINSLNSEATRSLPDLMETNEAIDTFEEPYAQNAPRSQASLQRAATNAQRHRFQTIEERNQERVSVDSSGGFLPLPEYTEEPNAPLPSRFRAMAGLDTPAQGPKKAAIVTNSEGDHRSPTSSGPSTAPAQVGENFSAEQAFSSAMAEQNRPSASRQQARQFEEVTTPTSPDNAAPPLSPLGRSSTSHSIQRTGTFDSVGSMPRSLQRAYGNAPIGTGPPPSLVGDWANLSPITRSNTGNFNAPQSPTSTMMNGRPITSEEEWDPTSPSGGRTGSAASTYTSTLHPDRAPSAASSHATSTFSSSHSTRRPPHMQYLQRAAANNAAASASLFPPGTASEHVPLRSTPARAGNVAHPITAWHPPAASSPDLLARQHSRKSSTSQRSAFASTSRARDLGFFKKGGGGGRRKKKPFDPQFGGGSAEEGRDGARAASTFETKSMFTTMTSQREGKCAVM